MNDEHTHAKIADPAACWFMLQFEVHLRVQDEGNPNQTRLRALIRRMRAHLKTSDMPYARPMLHLSIASVRIRTQRDSAVSTERERNRIFAPLHSALRGALALGDVGFLATLL